MDSVPQGLDDTDVQGLGSDQGVGTDTSNPKLPEFANRPGKRFQNTQFNKNIMQEVDFEQDYLQ